MTHDTVEKAIQWIWRLDRLAEVSTTATCEAVLHALTDKNVSEEIIAINFH